MQDRFATLPAVVVENAWRAYSYDSSAAGSALLEAFGEPEQVAVDGTRVMLVIQKSDAPYDLSVRIPLT